MAEGLEKRCRDEKFNRPNAGRPSIDLDEGLVAAMPVSVVLVLRRPGPFAVVCLCFAMRRRNVLSISPWSVSPTLNKSVFDKNHIHPLFRTRQPMSVCTYPQLRSAIFFRALS